MLKLADAPLPHERLLDARLRPLALGDVLFDPHVVRDDAGLVAYWTDRGGLPVQLAVLSPVVELPAPPAILDLRQHHFIMLAAHLAGLEDARILADGFLHGL